jgi:hypothetical protein
LKSTEIGVWSDHILNQLYPWINFIHNTFGIEKEPLVLAMKKVATQIELDIRSSTTPATAETVGKAPQECDKFYLIDGKNPQSLYVVTSMDKFNDRMVIVCRKKYNELCFAYVRKAFVESKGKEETEIVEDINKYCLDSGLVSFDDDVKTGTCDHKPEALPSLYMSSKMHKSIFGCRFIAGGSLVATTPVSKVVSVALRLFYPAYDTLWTEMFWTYTGRTVRSCPILTQTDSLIENLHEVNKWMARGWYAADTCKVGSSDFEQLYPSVQQEDLIDKVSKMVCLAMDTKTRLMKMNNATNGICNQALMVVKKYPFNKDKREPAARWVTNLDTAKVQDDEVVLDTDTIIKHFTFVIKNSFATFGGKIYKLKVGIPTGTNMSPEVTNIYLLWYEMNYWQRQLQRWDSIPKGQQLFMLTFSRYIDDLFKMQCTSVDNSFDFKSILYFNEESDGIYPSKLVDSEGTITTDPLKLTGEMGQTCNFLDATILIDPKLNRVTWALYNKRVDI